MEYSSDSIGELFKACDLDGSGFIDAQELSSICPDLEEEDVKHIFSELDRDGDGKISRSEFSEGFMGLGKSLGRRGSLALAKSISPPDGERRIYSHQRSTPKNSFDNLGDEDTMAPRDPNFNRLDSGKSEDLEADKELPEIGVAMDEGFTKLSCQEQVCELYQNLHSSDMPPLLGQFEDVIISVIRDIRQQQCENERLENSFKREKDQHARHLRQLEEEMEMQMQRVEARVRKEDLTKMESEKEEIKAELEGEIVELQTNLKKLQRLGSEMREEKPTEDFRGRLDDINHENRHLKSNLTDTQTSLAILKAELATSKQQYEEKCYELESEKHQLVQYINEQDNLQRQVHLLHDANTKLLDTNDSLRTSVDTARSQMKRTFTNDTRPLQRQMRGNPEYVKQYLQTSVTNFAQPYGATSPLSPLGGSSLAEELSMIEGGPQGQLFSMDSCEVDSLPDDVDSGRSTMKNAMEMDSEYEPNSIEDDSTFYTDRRSRSRSRRLRRANHFDGTIELELPESTYSGELDTEIEMMDEDELRPPSRCSACSRASSGRRGASPHMMMRQESACSSSGGVVTRRKLPTLPRVYQPITKEPERMYKVVLAGDAAVGKSSFIMRLCKNTFVANLNSTLGVDFQTKTLDVDGRIIALQLWDTAGQERFRSIAKSYFRRADGVLLVYDCTYERSFLSVREWVDAVEDGAQKRIPIMFVANKTDLRDETEKGGKKCVSFDDGQRLAREYEGLFIETSAKDGSNIMEAVTELARLLRTNEDLEVQSVGMQLHDIKEEKKKFGCCNI